MKIANEKDETFGGRNGKYCGVQYGNVSVTGQYAVLTFHSDSSVSRKGYNLTFTFAPVGCKYCDILFHMGLYFNLLRDKILQREKIDG